MVTYTLSTLWEVVKIAKDQNIDELPDQMNLNGIQISNEDLAEQLACMFEKKITDTVYTTTIDDTVYDGSRKINEHNKNFMSEYNIRKAILILKIKNSDGSNVNLFTMK